MTAITKQQGQVLLNFARAVLEKKFDEDRPVTPPADAAFAALRGTFVTLKKNHQLRGCIGNIEPVRSIRDGVEANVIYAAFHDSRFAPLTRQELDHIHISISILTEAEPLEFSNDKELCAALRKGVDGVILSCRHASATFLPQVWDQLPDAEQFLSHLSLKAGMSKDAWKTANVDISRYQVQSFGEEEK